MSGFCDSDKFKICDEWGETVVRHSRKLGEKVGGVYPNASWSDVVINDVDLDKTMKNQNEIEAIEIQKYLASLDEEKRPIFVNGRNVDYQVSFSEKGPERYSKGEGKYFRKRGATKHSKDYQTKPKKDIDRYNKIIEQENYENMREEIFDPIYDGDPCEFIQGYDLGCKASSRCWKEYPGPGFVRYGMFFPPPHWIYPSEDIIRIWTHMHAVEGGVGDKFLLMYNGEYYGPNHHNKKPMGIQFFDGKMDDYEVLESDNYKTMRANGSMRNYYIYHRVYKVQEQSRI